MDSCSHIYAVRPPNWLLMPANVGPIVAPNAYLPTTLLETTFRELAEGNARRFHAQIARRLN
jgi:hypothetical protein